MNNYWLELWRELIEANPHSPESGPIKRYKAYAHRKIFRPDPLLNFVLEFVNGDTTIIDVGAGDGRWSIPLARKGAKITAIEPDRDMLNILKENVGEARISVDIVQTKWEDAAVEKHDIVVSAHAIYADPDLSSFVRKMEEKAGKACFIAIRLPPADGAIAELMNMIYGKIHDSANAVVAYNALYSMGIYVNVLVEENLKPWINDSFESAVLRAKHHLHLDSDSRYDGLIRETLNRRLKLSGNQYIWPDGMRSALLWWKTDGY
jgi:FkbM family methyltransferase